MMITINKIKEDVKSWTPSTVILVDVSIMLIRSVAVRDPSSEE